MKKQFFLFVLTLLQLGLFAQNYNWARRLGGTGVDMGTHLTTDASGSVYTAGIFYATADFDPGPGTYTVSSAGGSDVYISKLDANGNFLWAKSFGGTGLEYCSAVKLDASGNLYLLGKFFGSVDFDPGAGVYTMNTNMSDDVFIMKLDGAGNFVWAKSFAGNNNAEGSSLDVDLAGNVYVTGYFVGTVDFDPGVATYPLVAGFWSPNGFAAKLDSWGSLVWAKSLEGDYGCASLSIAVDAVGNSYTTGSFQDTVDFNPGAGIFNLVSAGVGDVFVLKLDAQGNFAWAKRVGNWGFESGNSLALDGLGNVYVTGYFTGDVDFDPGAGVSTLTATGTSDIFVLKLNSTGTLGWAKSFAGTSFGNAKAIQLDALGHVYTTGLFQGTVDFDPGSGSHSLASVSTVTVPGFGDIFISRLDAAGNFNWVKRIGGLQYGTGESIRIDAAGHIYATGFFTGAMDFDPGAGTAMLTAQQGGDAFVLKLCTLPDPVATISGPVALCKGAAVANYSISPAVAASGYVWSTSPSAMINTGQNTTSVNITFIASANIVITPTNSCGSAISTSLAVIMSQCVGMAEHSAAALLNVYPNPASNFLTVELANGMEKLIQVYSITGAVVLETWSTSDQTVLNLEGLSNGVYVIKVKSNNSVETVKMIRQ